jgi:hypothetical protein
MKLGFACFAKFVDMSPDGTFTILGGGFDVLALDRVPGNIPILSLFILLDIPAEEAGLHTLKLTGIGPTGDSFEPFSAEQQFKAEAPPSSVTQDMKLKLILFLSGLHFPQEGLYVVRFQSDGNELGELRMHVRQKPVHEGKSE